MKPDTYWEAAYADGTVVREADGPRYPDIDRENLTEFRLVTSGVEIFLTRPPVGADGTNLRYRRTTEVGAGGSVSMIRIGWEPQGPAFLIDPSALDEDRPGVWIAEEGFHACVATCGHPAGWFDPPVPIGGER